MTKRRIFVAYCSHRHAMATELKKCLEEDFEVHLWHEKEKAGNTLLNNLIEQMESCQYGIAILSSDDQLVSNRNKPWVPRDNVIQELGFFLSQFGNERTAIISVKEPDGYEPKLPTDMAGWQLITVNSIESTASIISASKRIREHFNTSAKIIPSLIPHSASHRGFNVLTMDDVKTAWGRLPGIFYCLNPSWTMEHNDPDWLKIHIERYHNPDFSMAHYIVDIDRGRDPTASESGSTGKPRHVNEDYDLWGIVRFMRELCKRDPSIREKINTKLRVYVCPGAKLEMTTFVSQYKDMKNGFEEKRGFMFVRNNTSVNTVLEARSREEVEILHKHLITFTSRREPYEFGELEALCNRILRH